MKENQNQISFQDVEEPGYKDIIEQPPKIKAKDPVVEFWKTQVIVCVLALLAVGVCRLVGGDVYRNVRDKYIQLFCDTTTVEEVTQLPPQPDKTPVTPTTVTAMATVTPTVVPVIQSDFGDSPDDSLAVKENMLLLTGTASTQNQMTVPVKGVVTSEFGYRIHPIYGTRMFHNGVDIGADSRTPIVAALAGVVETADYNESYGYYVILNHGKDFKTVYAHCSRLDVSKGDGVQQGDTIALVGSTGVSTGPHLHFEVRRGEYRVNPAWLVDLS
ncbi:MAG: M23 family metallopeptidase [Clostridia bacterium]|nr:M23 family metallopeptidase [Clostridia bacterium]